MNDSNIHWLSLERITPKQWLLLKESIVDANNRLNRVFPSFDPFSSKFSPGNRLIVVFSSYFSFHSMNRRNEESIKPYICELDEITFQASSDPKTAVVVSDISIKNQVTTSITYIYIHDSPVIKTIHHIINITFTEAKLFAIRYSINQATWLSNINQIIIIMDLIHATKRIFGSSIHSYQIQSLFISRELREFFNKDYLNSIKFWDCPSHENWTLHSLVNKEMKKFNLVLIFPCKSSWDFNRKNECNKILNNWRMTF